MMSQILQLAHFVKQYGMPKVQVGSSGVKSGLDPEWPI